MHKMNFRDVFCVYAFPYLDVSLLEANVSVTKTL